MIIGEQAIHKIAVRYLGIGKPLTTDEREILLMALYAESLDKPDSIFSKATKVGDDRLASQRVIPVLPGRKTEVWP